MSKITLADVQKIAALSRLELAPDESEKIAAQLARILEYVETLNAVNVDGVEAYAFATVDETALRADTPGAGLPRAPALQNAAHADDEFFLVPAIVK